VDLSSDVVAALQVLRVDRTTVAASARLRDAGIPHVLLKGPSTARWLYPDPARRPYVDTDFLVPPRHITHAVEVLSGLRLFAPLASAGPTEQDGHSVVMRPREGSPLAEVDLHHSLPGVGVPANTVWSVLAANTETFPLLGAEVDILNAVGRALVVTLHAARNGTANAQSTEDLRLLLNADVDWERVRSLAEKLGALPAFARGLRLIPESATLRAHLIMGDTTSIEMELREAGAAPLAHGFDRLMSTKSWSRRSSIVIRELWPSKDFLAYWANGQGLPEDVSPARARLIRAKFLLLQVWPSLQAYCAARRRVREVSRGRAD
jgi:hypothetical protein